MGRNSPASAGDTGYTGSISGSGKPTKGGNGNPLQFSCLESPVGRGAWWARVHGIAESDMTEYACVHRQIKGRPFYCA